MAVMTMGPSPEMGPELNLIQFVNAHADNRSGKELSSIGPLSQKVFYAIQNEGTTDAMLATNFWRAWLASEGAEKLLRNNGASRVGLDNCRTIIVPRPQLLRFDLVVLDPGLAPDFDPVAIDVSSATSLPQLEFGAQLSVTKEGMRHIWGDAPSLIPEAFNYGKQPYSVVLASSPRFERLMVPDQPLDVYSATTGQHSTAGAVVEDLTKAGRIGVTAALHGIGSAATSVTVAGQSGTVVRTSSVTDSAFIEMSTKPSCSALSAKGIMSGFAPRGSQAASFVGLTSNKRSTTIVGWDPQVPTPSGYRQACIYTGRDAQAGDSGSALVSDDDWIVGFAFERSLPGHNPVQCSWIWAESVFNALQVKLI
jgi:hypothetical protein